MANEGKNPPGDFGGPGGAADPDGAGRGREHEEPVVHDKRRIDPETGEVRHPGNDSGGTDGADAEDTLTEEDLAFLTDAAAGGAAAGAPADAEGRLAAERLADLQRLQAEYVNYRKRVERDREAVRELAVAEVIKGLLPVLDDLDRAHAHGDLEGSPLDLVAQKLRAAFERYGLTAVGAKGDLFDHNLHEAIYQQPSPDVTVNTVSDVIERGYLLGERLLRPAKVAVDVPAE
jgi:molecular chaperone GrpE